MKASNCVYIVSVCFLLGNFGCVSQSKHIESRELKNARYEQMKEMFQEMVVKKDASAIPKYYHPEFLLISNGQKMDYAENLRFHQEVYKTPIQYHFQFDPETVVEQGDRIAMRVFITTQRPSEQPRKIEVILIVKYLDDKIYRVWELTYPDWSKLPAFSDESRTKR